MDRVQSESSVKNIITIWLSFVIIKTINNDCKKEFQILEKYLIKETKLKSHLSFNETCLINRLLPTYTNIRLHDDAALQEQFVIKFREDLIKRQIDEQKIDLRTLNQNIQEQRIKLKEKCPSDIHYQAFVKFLDRSISKLDSTLKETQNRKLCNIYGGNIKMKQTSESVINLSSIDIDNNIVDIMSLGMNFQLQRKIDPIARKVEVEKLYENIKDKERNGSIKISDDSNLKTELERFGKKKLFGNKNPLTKDQNKLIKDFINNNDVIIRKADKSNIFVVLDMEKYISTINNILNNNEKFEKLEKDPTDDIKRKINTLITRVNKAVGKTVMNKLYGHYSPGYIYANPKIHKSITDPTFRPIISQIGTATYEASKFLNNIIKQYIPKTYQVESTYEFLSLIKSCKNPPMIASLDVDNLFTNVPVSETIEIILKNVYNNDSIPPPIIPKNIMKELLYICTTETPFRNINGDIYKQRGGISMGSVLGSTFANYYMCNLENSCFENDPQIKPKFYARYVDDICVIVDKFNDLIKIKNKFESSSSLKFTYETEIKKQMPFLDVLMERNSTISTSVYVKPTNSGDCLNYNSICPERYKSGTVKTFLHRAYHVSNSWLEFDQEVNRIKQLLTNNSYPMLFVEKIISNFLNSKINNDATNPKNYIELYYENQMSTNYKQDERQLNNIIKNNISATDENYNIKLTVFYKNKKIKQLFIKNNLNKDSTDIGSRHHCVYSYICNMNGCNSVEYIGYSSCKMTDRFRMHTQNSSSIKKHLMEHHQISKVKTSELLPNIKILYHSNNTKNLIFAEAFFIKSIKPQLNAQNEGCERILKVFKH